MQIILKSQVEMEIGKRLMKILAALVFKLTCNYSKELLRKQWLKNYENIQGQKGSDAKMIFFTLQPLTSRHLVAADGNTDAQQTVKMFCLLLSLSC